MFSIISVSEHLGGVQTAVLVTNMYKSCVYKLLETAAILHIHRTFQNEKIFICT